MDAVELQPISWSALGYAWDCYRSAGIIPVELPWVAHERASFVTCPDPDKVLHIVHPDWHDCTLVGSAEQAFIDAAWVSQTRHFDLGRIYMAIGPCFRMDPQDEFHQRQFMKLELFAPAAAAQVVTLENTVRRLAFQCLSDLLSPEQQKFLSWQRQGEEDDLLLGGIEVGSYGVRQWEGHSWVYGTGLAEPRFSQARRLLPC